MRSDRRGKSDPHRKRRALNPTAEQSSSSNEGKETTPPIESKTEKGAAHDDLLKKVKERILLERIARMPLPSRRALLRKEKKTIADVYGVKKA